MWLFFCYTIQLITIKLCTKFQNPKSSSCLEIFDRKKVYRQTNRQTNIITEKAKTIYPLYTSYRGYKYILIDACKNILIKKNYTIGLSVYISTFYIHEVYLMKS